VKEYTYRYFVGLRRISGKALLKLASKVKVPILIVQGRKDVIVDPIGVEELYRRIKIERKSF